MAEDSTTIQVQMEGIVEPTYNKRRKGYVFKQGDYEVFIKGEDKDAAMKQMQELIEDVKEDKEESDNKNTFSEGGLEDGGLKDEGGTVDPVSGNEVPSGSTQSEVRDDIPAQLSEGEFVLPADVVRYIGLENLMELRNKAKQGLQQMEDMGQMGNSEEAIMPDTAEMEVDIDAMIDEFDPNDPEIQSFAEGGMPTYAYEPPQNIYGQQNYSPYTGQTSQMQQFTAGYMPQTTYTPPPIPGQGSQFQGITQPEQGGNVEQRQYVGPNGELRTFTFIDGKPTEEIPAGFTVYKPEEQAAPQVVRPQVQQVDRDSGDNRQQQEERQAEYEGWVGTMEDLAELDPQFAESWENSPHNPNKGFGLGEFISMGGVFGALKNDYDLNKSAQQAYENIANQYGLNIDDYKNEFTFFGLDKYKESSLVNDAKAARDISGSLGMDPRDLARTDLDSDRDGRVTKDDLVDTRGNLTQAGLDLFNIEDESADPADIGVTSRQKATAVPDYRPPSFGSDSRDDSDGPDFTDQTADALGLSDRSEGSQASQLADQDAGLFKDEQDRADFYGEDYPGSSSDSGSSSSGNDRWCCSRMVHHDLWTVEREFARLSAWSRKQPKWWRSGYPVWGKIVAKYLLGKQGFWTDVMQAFYDNHVMKKPRSLKSTLADVIIFPGSFVCGLFLKPKDVAPTLASVEDFK